MIYLFDDNKYGQLSTNYKVDFLEYFSNNTCYIKHIKTHDEYNLKLLLRNADCVLIHQSFPDEIKSGIVKASCKKEGIPIVTFSNQYTGTVFADTNRTHIDQIKKDRLYFNFIHFMVDYVESGKPDIKLLAMGKNYDVEKALIIQDRLLVYLFMKQENFDFYRCFEEDETEWKELKELHFLAFPDADFDQFQEEIENTTAAELREIAKTLTSQILKRNGY